MNLTGIFEMSPYNIPQSDFNMSDDAQNTSLADTTINQLGRRKAKILKKIIDDIWLCSSPKEVVLLDRIQLRIIYYVEYQIEYIKLIKTTALTQVLVWRDKISKIGLAPKTKSVRADHLARVYVTTSSALAIALIPDLAKQRLNQAKASTYDPSKYNPVKYYKDWSVLQIDTTKVPGVRGLSYLTLYKDPNIPNIKGAGFFTLNYIPPDAITMIKRIKL